MSNLALISTLAFIAVTMALSFRRKLGLEKEIAVATVRSAVQLFLIGYVLHYVFNANHKWVMILMIAVMIAVASWNAGGRARQITGIRLRIAAAIGCTELITMGLLIGLQIIEPKAQFIIPLSGMIIGIAMVVSGLYLNQMQREMQTSRGEIETLLALGATTGQSIQGSMKRAVRSSMIPSIDGMKTVGLVQLPGVMTGMIVAGADPIGAVRYQILIMFLLLASAALTSMLLSIISYKLWFTEEGNLKKH